jgi:protein tyrosine phosphatase
MRASSEIESKEMDQEGETQTQNSVSNLPARRVSPSGLSKAVDRPDLHYRKKGLHVEHIPVRDRLRPPLSRGDLNNVWQAYQRLPKPVLIHCSAGIGRSRQAVCHIKRELENLNLGD